MKTKDQNIKERIFENYGKDRFDTALNQSTHLIDHFGKKANKIKKRYKFARFTSIVAASLVTILAFLNITYSWTALKWIIPSISILATVLATLVSITNAQKDWIYNRSASQKFQKEQFLYLQKAGVYKMENPEDRVTLFSERLMAIWDEVHQEWQNIKLEK